MTRKRRSLIVAGILAGCVAVALGVLAMLPPRPGLTKANFDRIEKGMTLAEVQHIFGQEGHGPLFPTGFKNQTFWSWGAHDNPLRMSEVGVEFLDNCVTKKGWYGSAETIPDKLRRWLNLPK